MSDKASGGGFNPRAEPGRLTTKEFGEINQMYAGNLQQFADNINPQHGPDCWDLKRHSY